MNDRPATASANSELARKRARKLDEEALATLFTQARTARKFLPEAVPHALLRRLVELVELGPTSSNTLPLRLLFVETPAAKERLRPALARGNIEKTLAAPVTAIVAADLRFHTVAPKPSAPDVKLAARFDNAPGADDFARLQATLQGAYLHLAARALGLDVGPMGGFDREAVDREFFPDGRNVSLWLVNLGYGDDAKLSPRAPRFRFDEVARII